MKKIVDLPVRWCSGALVLFRSGALVLWCSILMALSFAGVSHASGDVEDILQEARAKYLEFRQVATDITILRTFTEKGKVIVEEKLYEEKLYKKGERFRLETVRPPDKITTIRIYDGENLWEVVPERGIRQKISREARKGVLFFDDWFNFFCVEELKLDRRERLGDRDCYVLAGRDNLFLWIDRETLALIKLEAGEDKEGKVTITLSDFEMIEGWEISFSAEMRKNGRLFGSSSLKLDIETVLDPILFCAESIEIKDPPPFVMPPLPPPPPPPLD